jgi:hypothetical protein
VIFCGKLRGSNNGACNSTLLTWNAHINNITSKAQKLLGFLRRNLQIKNEHTKSMAYK